ncbi:hypothetical protein AGMMS50230_14220 [Spirochaetia bacterium]|nr:hypothetical protein AGMMS50230_14220 [Spirochaetia bacterium]
MKENNEKKEFDEKMGQKLKADLQNALYIQHKVLGDKIAAVFDKARNDLDSLYKEYLTESIDLKGTQTKV